MVNVLEKAFGILERIVASTPDPMVPAQLARDLNINRATCSRLLKQLMESGYVVKVSRQQGYAAGPKLLTLNNAARFEHGLLAAAVPVIDRCAEALKCSVLLAQLHQRKRYVLYHRNCSPVLDIRISKPCYDDIFSTATGLVLIAHSDFSEQIACLREQKAAGCRIFPGFGSEKTLKNQLRIISGAEGFDCQAGRQWIYAFPVFRDGRFCAVIGASIALDDHTPAFHRQVRKALNHAAQEISSSLNPQYIVG